MENKQTYFCVLLQIEARDGGRPSKSNQCQVIVTAVPVMGGSSSHPPQLLGPPSSQVTVLETDHIGHFVKLIEAQDLDGDKLYFDIVGEPEFSLKK